MSDCFFNTTDVAVVVDVDVIVNVNGPFLVAALPR